MKVDSTLREAARNIGRDEARFLVDTYYQMQEYRKASANQLGAGERGTDTAPMVLLDWLCENMGGLEETIKRLMGDFAEQYTVGRWCLGVYGIGPVISAGLLAHIDIERAPTVGHIWRFAGLDPTVTWGKGERRPWNAQLKTLCWKIGDSFVKFSGRDECFYGQLYQSLKAQEVQRNEAGEFAEQALAIAADKPKHAQVATYLEGKLPASHVDARARRQVVKLFLSHWHEVAYWEQFGEAPPNPYVLEHWAGAHVHRIDPPGWTRPAA